MKNNTTYGLVGATAIIGVFAVRKIQNKIKHMKILRKVKEFDETVEMFEYTMKMLGDAALAETDESKKLYYLESSIVSSESYIEYLETALEDGLISEETLKAIRKIHNVLNGITIDWIDSLKQKGVITATFEEISGETLV